MSSKEDNEKYSESEKEGYDNYKFNFDSSSKPFNNVFINHGKYFDNRKTSANKKKRSE